MSAAGDTCMGLLGSCLRPCLLQLTIGFQITTKLIWCHAWLDLALGQADRMGVGGGLQRHFLARHGAQVLPARRDLHMHIYIHLNVCCSSQASVTMEAGAVSLQRPGDNHATHSGYHSRACSSSPRSQHVCLCSPALHRRRAAQLDTAGSSSRAAWGRTGLGSIRPVDSPQHRSSCSSCSCCSSSPAPVVNAAAGGRRWTATPTGQAAAYAPMHGGKAEAS